MIDKSVSLTIKFIIQYSFDFEPNLIVQLLSQYSMKGFKSSSWNFIK